jgi:hypothetical protein
VVLRVGWPYNSSNYGQYDDTGTVANGESLMFYANGLGLMARNKVFNDQLPSAYYAAIKSQRRALRVRLASLFPGRRERQHLERANGGPDRGFGCRRPPVAHPPAEAQLLLGNLGDFTLKIRYHY